MLGLITLLFMIGLATIIIGGAMLWGGAFLFGFGALCAVCVFLLLASLHH